MNKRKNNKDNSRTCFGIFDDCSYASPKTTACVEDPETSSGIMPHLGFTLIELLVVVLIIAVLAAIALPQYQHAINKVRYVSMMEAVNAAKRSQELYYLTHGSYATSFEDLKADLPGNCSGSSQHCNCGNFSLYLDSAHCVYALPHKEPKITYTTYYDHASYNAGKRACGTVLSSQLERAKKLCRSVTGNDSEGFNFFF